MWLNKKQIAASSLSAHRASLLGSCPKYVVIDNLFDTAKLDDVMSVLEHEHFWRSQKHTYSALYVNKEQWQSSPSEERFVKRDVWKRDALSQTNSNAAHDFLSFLRGNEFMSIVSHIFNVQLTDMNVAKPHINTNYFRLNASDFINQHADDSPGREVCMLLYLNKDWYPDAGGELVFAGEHDKTTSIAPLYNRCVLFDPSSPGSEHWVKPVSPQHPHVYRYNVTSWYWKE
jgi:Rps23 Pro-64 3,4-dihydroxylase Tpa1-like proline 4-hydroxylase